MQSITWYVKRIQMMSPKEIIWRVTSLTDAFVERGRVQFNLVPTEKYQPSYDPDANFVGGFEVFTGEVEQFQNEWKNELIKKSEMILDHKLSYFDLKEHDLETPINWHKDHSANIFSSLNHIVSVNYRDFANNGDCKLVWEPNRHHQLVVLGRAYKVTGDTKYAQGVIDQLTAWLDANPYGYGMNWRSPLELAIRLISWVWAIDLIKGSGLFAGDIKARLLNSVFLHCRDVDGKYSQGTSANNHLVGEAAGVYIAASYFDMLTDAPQWQARSKAVLEREIQAQSFADGCTKEHAFSYQFFVFQFYLFTALTGKWRKDDFSAQYWQTLSSISRFIAQVAEGGKHYPMLGDQDDGYVLDLGDHVHNINALCDISGYFYSDEIFNTGFKKSTESAFWLFSGRDTRLSPSVNDTKPLSSVAFKESGYYLLQAGSLAQGNQASVLFDCAELGYTAIAAHGHADALSFVMRINKNDLFVDTGTYDYFSHPQWRNHFRTTKAHNTLEVDGVDQSVMTGPFMWEQHAQANCIEWSPTNNGGTVFAEHSGYLRLSEPVNHQRAVQLDVEQKKIIISDHVLTSGTHDIALYFHLSEDCQNIELNEGVCTLKLGDDQIAIQLPMGMRTEVVTGQESNDKETPALGWLSRGYHQKVAISTLVLRTRVSADSKFETIINW
ncbi:heparinase [Psychromonas sp. psych-6C06]|uniref:alginate lyase family protein n=1 Tax=Psychromonas sp. psych-6C06 TaxID=2058089 RepID=UPI000C34B63A|nr:alginate lyase family protein [Psychromonas sp. psych-6C06]PKF61444.1 heparinase [Psychromonas sp. psych-6C06]